MKLPRQQKSPETEEGSSDVDIAKYGERAFYPGNLEDDKTFKKFIKSSEMIIRRSPELRAYIQYLKDELDLRHCTFFHGIDPMDVSIELHHYPFSLYDLTEIITRSFLRNSTPLSTFSVAYQVVRLHYENRVGLVPLTKTAHDLAHAGKVYIPLTAVHGDVRSFLEEYQLDVGSQLLLRLKEIMVYTPEKIETLNSVLEARTVYNALPQNEAYLSLLGGLDQLEEEAQRLAELEDAIPPESQDLPF